MSDMTREEAIANLNMISVAFVEPVTKEQRKLIDDTFDMAIKALEQEPCDDAISREMALKECHDIVVEGERYRVIQEETLLGLPPVNPQEPKTGHWDEVLQYAELKVNTEFENLMIVAIKKGTPLPKGHGRLIDADDAKREWQNVLDCEVEHPRYQCTIRDVLEDAPTIIGADTEESNTDNKSDDELYADAIDAFKVVLGYLTDIKREKWLRKATMMENTTGALSIRIHSRYDLNEIMESEE